ncbi:MAG: hypothetical protein KBE23_22085 [Chloroflexi bacterium]|nr:hypothetical protein [Chloroflexota bacterium]MBP7045456.1 hypothetical protein [Chloroflexota bacterium]
MLNQTQPTLFRPKWLLPGLLLLLAAALFPYGLIGEALPWVNGLFFDRFSSLAAHVVGHMGLFALVGTAVLLTFPRLLTHPRIYLGVMLLLGVLQEAFQIIGFKHRGLVFDDFFDVGVDMLAALLVWLIVKKWRSARG